MKNATFCRADLHDREIPGLLGSLPDPDLIIIDPPRAGMHKNLVNHVLEANPERITYVSCNPATQARDCALLSEKYEVIKIR
ncbi:MAG: 23S rRNA (uracil-5-)-methyltransferase RumA, partial [Bacteroidota bacterium]